MGNANLGPSPKLTAATNRALRELQQANATNGQPAPRPAAKKMAPTEAARQAALQRHATMQAQPSPSPDMQVASPAMSASAEVVLPGRAPQPHTAVDDSHILNKTKKKQYMPQQGQGNWAILMALYNRTQEGHSLEENVLKNEAEVYSDHTMFAEHGQVYSAFSSVGKIIEKGWVQKLTSPTRYALTNDGRTVAAALWHAHQTGEKVPVVYEDGTVDPTHSATEPHHPHGRFHVDSNVLNQVTQPPLHRPPAKPSAAKRTSSAQNLQRNAGAAPPNNPQPIPAAAASYTTPGSQLSAEAALHNDPEYTTAAQPPAAKRAKLAASVKPTAAVPSAHSTHAMANGAAHPVTNSVDVDWNMDVDPPAPAPKKRGRPPKNATPAKQTAAPAASVPTASLGVPHMVQGQSNVAGASSAPNGFAAHPSQYGLPSAAIPTSVLAAPPSAPRPTPSTVHPPPSPQRVQSAAQHVPPVPQNLVQSAAPTQSTANTSPPRPAKAVSAIPQSPAKQPPNSPAKRPAASPTSPKVSPPRPAKAASALNASDEADLDVPNFDEGAQVPEIPIPYQPTWMIMDEYEPPAPNDLLSFRRNFDPNVVSTCLPAPIPPEVQALEQIPLDTEHLNVPLVEHKIRSIAVYVDSREKRRKKPEENLDYFQNPLQDQGFEVRTYGMALGDFMWAGVCEDGTVVVLDSIVERKTTHDLATSILDDRYYEQRWRLRHSGMSKIYYMVEGTIDPDDRTYGGVKPPALLSAICNVTVADRITVLRPLTPRDSIKYLIAITRQMQATYVGKTVYTAPTEHLFALKVRHNGVTAFESIERCIVDDSRLLWEFFQFQKHSERYPTPSGPDLFGLQLTMIPGFKHSLKVGAIVARWRTLPTLIQAYLAAASLNDRYALLSEIEVDGRRVGTAAAKEVHDAIMGPLAPQ